MGQVYALLAKKSLCLKSISFGNLEPNFFRIIARSFLYQKRKYAARMNKIASDPRKVLIS
jgi:hypothetical protein